MRKKIKELVSSTNTTRGGLLSAPACQPSLDYKDAIKALRTAHLAELRQTSTMPDEELQSLAKYHKWSDKTANGLTKMIVAFLDYSGHYANRINTQGQAIVTEVSRYNVVTDRLDTSKKITGYRKGTTKKGTPDIDAIISGKPAKIEVKIGKYRVSPAQLKQMLKIEQAGGLYYIAKDFTGFYNWYLMINQPI